MACFSGGVSWLRKNTFQFLWVIYIRSSTSNSECEITNAKEVENKKISGGILRIFVISIFVKIG